LKTTSLFALTMTAYCSLLGFLSLLTRRSLVVGVAYLVIFEGVLANIDFVVRKLTVMYYFRVLSERWIGIPWREIDSQGINQWSIDLSKAPSNGYCVLTLVLVSLFATALAAMTFMAREFRMKTPEES